MQDIQYSVNLKSIFIHLVAVYDVCLNPDVYREVIFEYYKDCETVVMAHISF